MNHMLLVCLLAMSLVGAAWAGRQSPAGFPLLGQTAHLLQQGVSVQLAVTNNAQPFPEADQADAWIVAVTADGRLYFGTTPVTPKDLSEEMKSRPRDRSAKLYIKADARTPFTAVRQVLQAGREVDFQKSVLLTSQPGALPPGSIQPPKGFDVSLNPAASSDAVSVQLRKSTRQTPKMKVNNQDLPEAVLETTLRQLSQNQKEPVVVIKADGQLPFAEVMYVIDVCSSVGAKVALTELER